MDQEVELPLCLDLEGASNLRDLGGWPGAGGRRVRFGQVYRSASLARLTDEDAATLAGLGLRTVVDLRSEEEQARLPSRLDGVPGVEVCALPLEASPGFDLRGLIAAPDTTREDFLDWMRSAYRAYALDCGDRYARLFALLSEPARRPLLFHCTAGKDRTGVAAALLLSALGVSRTAVRQDYLTTNVTWRGEPEFSRRLPPLAVEILLHAHAEVLDSALDAIAAKYNTLENYLAHHLSIDLPHLRGELLE